MKKKLLLFKNFKKGALCILALLLCLFVSSCGKKAPPKLPSPVKTKEIKIQNSSVEEGKISLSWTNDADLLQAKSFDIYRSENEGDFSKVASVSAERKTDEKNKKILKYSDSEGLERGRWYHYVISAINNKGELTGISETEDIFFSEEVSSPDALVGKLIYGFVKLKWNNPYYLQGKGKEDKIAGYNIYRRRAGDEFFKPVNKALIRKTSFVDMKIKKDNVYEYVVKSVDNFFPPWHESFPSGTVVIDTADRVPPETPSGLVAVGGVDRISLRWGKSVSGDVAGYNIYRSDSESGEFILQNEGVLANEYYDDVNVQAGESYYYRVSAVDNSDNVNESELSEVASSESF